MAHNVTTQLAPEFGNLLLTVAIEPDEIGRRLKTARERKGWTQLQFAMEANVSPSSVQRWESGRLPPVRELMRLADVLGVEAEEFVEPAVPKGDAETLQAIQEELSALHADVRKLLRRARDDAA